MHPNRGVDTPPSVLPIIKIGAVVGHVKAVEDLQESKTPDASRIQRGYRAGHCSSNRVAAAAAVQRSSVE
jgi:hypothetical protein